MLKNSIQKKKIKILPEIRIKRFISTSDGITILALIITIIVLIILSGITIVGLTGEEGLQGEDGRVQTRASWAEGENTEEAEGDEEHN